VEQWEKEILAAKEDCIPSKLFTTIPHHKLNHHLNVLKTLYQEIIRRSETSGGSEELRQRYRALQIQLKETSKNLNHENWGNLQKELTVHSAGKDPKTFWNKIRRLKGNDTPTSPYLLKPQNEKIYKDAEKEKLHMFWPKAFKISDFDDQFENVIRRDLARFPRKLVPYQTINLGMLLGRFAAECAD